MKVSLAELMREGMRDVIKEVPGDAQYVELTGSMIRAEARLLRDPSVRAVDGVPLCLSSMDVDDPEAWNEMSHHTLYVQESLREGTGVSFDIVAVDGYLLEDHDSARVLAYLKTRSSLFNEIKSAITRNNQ